MDFIRENWIELMLVILLLIVSFDRIKKSLKNIFKHFLKITKNISLNVIIKSINKLSKVELYLNNFEGVRDDSLKLEDLTANLSSAENRNQLKIYLDSLKSAILNVNVTNIALTGGFGSGKSTIINEFIKQNRGFEYLPISLANFNDEKNDEKIIEASIVQQILYFEKKQKLKESSFNRIYFSKPYTKFAISFLVLLWIYSIVYLFFEKINSKIFLGSTSIRYIDEIFIIIFISGFFTMIYKSFNVLKNIKFSKITQSSIEIVNEKTDKDLSVFNRNIEEIIYFFEKTNTNVVIIEDIDRFNDEVAIKLFSKIRELSLLLKQAKDITQPVKFIFSVKDELILNQKTKFFDLIIPVIPIIDYKNSKNKFFDKLKEFIDVGNLDRNFIAEVAGYIYDMRTVINICNEFKIYHSILDNEKMTINSDKLFAIILYKNLFPEDFAKIQKRKSRLHQVFFVKRKELIDSLNENLESQKDKLDVEINKLAGDIENAIDFDVKELRKIYIYEAITILIRKFPDYNIKKIEDIDISKNFLFDDENFSKILNSKNITVFTYTSVKSGITFKEIEKSVNPNVSYVKREQLIKDFHENKLNKLKFQRIEISSKINSNNELNLNELYIDFPDKIEKFIHENYLIEIKKEDLGKKRDLVETKKDGVQVKKEDAILMEIMPNIDLLRDLIKNDYINEDFIEYISYFHPGSLSKNDNDLKMKIIQNSMTSFNERIDNVIGLISEIQDNRFKQESVLIFDLLSILLEGCQIPHIRSGKLDFILHQLYNYNDKTVLFLQGYITKINQLGDDEIISNFYVEMTKWDGFWELIDANFTNELKRYVLFDLINLFSGDDIGNNVLEHLNKRKKLSTSIEKDKDFLKDIYDRINETSLIKTLKILNIKFDSIAFEDKISTLVMEMYKNNLYKINVNNFKLFSQLDTNYTFSEELFLNSNYSFLSSQDTPIFKMIQNDKDKYLQEVYFKIGTNINENSDSILQFLKSEDVNDENKLKIIEKGFNGKLKEFGKLHQKELYKIILQKNKITASWENVLEYFGFEGEWNEISIEFMNQEENYQLLSMNYFLENTVKLFGEGNKYFDFIYLLINSTEILDNCFESLFDSVDNLQLEPSKIEIDDRLKFLIEKGYIQLSDQNYEYLRGKNSHFIALLIVQNEDDFMANIDNYNIDESTLQSLLSSEISLQNKKAIIKKEESNILLFGASFLQQLTEFFLKNDIVDYSFEIYYHILEADITEKIKVKLFNLDFPTHNEDNVTITSLEKLGGDYLKILKKEDVEFPNEEPFIAFLNIMKVKRLIRRTYDKKDNTLKVSYVK